MRSGYHCAGRKPTVQINKAWARTQNNSIRSSLSNTHTKSLESNTSLNNKMSPIMIKSDADLPYINQVLVAHGAKNIVYRRGPARKVQMVTPRAPLPSPQSAVIRILRPILRRLNASLNLGARKGQCESGDLKAGSAPTKAEDAKTGHIENRRPSNFDHRAERHSPIQMPVSHREHRFKRTLCAANFYDRNSEDILCNEDGTIVVRTHRPLCAADFEDSDDEDSFCDDGDIRAFRGFNLEARVRWADCNNELKSRQGRQLTTLQLRINANMLREIAHRAFRERENGENEFCIFSEETSEEGDWVLEMVLEMMDLGQVMVDAGEFQGEEGSDIQMMVQNNLETLIRKATRPFRPSGIRAVEVELFQCLEAFRQMRLELLQRHRGMSMEEILKERSLDLRPR